MNKKEIKHLIHQFMGTDMPMHTRKLPRAKRKWFQEFNAGLLWLVDRYVAARIAFPQEENERNAVIAQAMKIVKHYRLPRRTKKRICLFKMRSNVLLLYIHFKLLLEQHDNRQIEAIAYSVLKLANEGELDGPNAKELAKKVCESVRHEVSNNLSKITGDNQ